MKVCTYDNPATLCRECWQNGDLVISYTKRLIQSKDWPPPPHLLHMGANVGPWTYGKVWGDIDAMPDDAIGKAYAIHRQ